MYVKINGSKGKLPKKQLTKKAGSVKKKKARFRFAPGSTHVFKFDGKDIGEIKNVVVEVSHVYYSTCFYTYLSILYFVLTHIPNLNLNFYSYLLRSDSALSFPAPFIWS